jgi:hypothetical protein
MLDEINFRDIASIPFNSQSVCSRSLGTPIPEEPPWHGEHQAVDGIRIANSSLFFNNCFSVCFGGFEEIVG